MEIVIRNLPTEIVILTIISPSFNPKFLLNFGKVNRFRLVLLTIILYHNRSIRTSVRKVFSVLILPFLQHPHDLNIYASSKYTFSLSNNNSTGLLCSRLTVLILSIKTSTPLSRFSMYLSMVFSAFSSPTLLMNSPAAIRDSSSCVLLMSGILAIVSPVNLPTVEAVLRRCASIVDLVYSSICS